MKKHLDILLATSGIETSNKAEEYAIRVNAENLAFSPYLHHVYCVFQLGKSLAFRPFFPERRRWADTRPRLLADFDS